MINKEKAKKVIDLLPLCNGRQGTEDFFKKVISVDKLFQLLDILDENDEKLELIIEKLNNQIEDCQNGANDKEVAYWNNAIRTSIDIVRSMI